MAIAFKRAKVALNGASEVALYTHPGGSVVSVQVVGLMLPNDDTVAHTFTIRHKTSGGAYSPVKRARVDPPAPGFPPFEVGDIPLVTLEAAGDAVVAVMEGPHTSTAPEAHVTAWEKS